MFLNHVHIIPKEISPGGGIEPFLRLVDAFELEGAVCFAPFTYQMDPLGLNPNRWLYQQIKGKDYLIGYGTLDPTRAPGDQIKEIADLGFRGVKLHPAAQKFDVFGVWARAAYESLVTHNLIADFHTGVHWHRLRDSHPLQFDEVAFHYPELVMVFEHMGGWHYFREMVAVVVNNQQRGNRLYAGIASVLDPERQRYWYLGLDGLKGIKWQIGVQQMIYGMDYPYNDEAQLRRDVDMIRGCFPAEEAIQILGGNLRALLGLSP